MRKLDACGLVSTALRARALATQEIEDLLPTDILSTLATLEQRKHEARCGESGVTTDLGVPSR